MSTTIQLRDPSRKIDSGVHTNVWKLHFLKMAYEGMFIMPVLIPFFQSHRVTLKEMFWLQAIFAIAAFLTDIPTGYLADKWGRKNTLIVSGLFAVSGMFTYALSSSFWGFFFGEVLLAFHVSLNSGTVEALMYDTLLDTGDVPSYRRLSGSVSFWGFISQAIASIAGGLIAVYSLRLTVWATTASFSLGLLVAVFLVEPRRHKMQDQKHFAAMWRISKNTLVSNVPLRSIVCLEGALSTLTLVLVWYTQPYQEMFGLPLVWFGLAHAVMMLGSAIASRSAHIAQKWIDDRLLLIAMAAAVIVSYIGLGLTMSLWGVVFLLLGRSMWGLFTPVINDLVNRMTTSDVRATVLSVMSSASRLIAGIVLFLVGYTMDVLTINQSILLTGVVSGLGLTIMFVAMRNTWNKIPS